MSRTSSPGSRSASRRWDYAAYLNRRIKLGNWFAQFRDDFRHFTGREADLIHHLLNVGKVRSSKEGWIPCTSKFLAEGLGLSPDKQERILQTLQKKRVVEVKWLGAFRHLRLNLARLDRLAAE